MAKKRRKSSGGKRRRRSNPFGSSHRKQRRTGRRRNPTAMLGGTFSILKDGFYALLGLVIARQGPQMVLGVRNTGVIGYLANIVTTVLAAMIGGKMLGPVASRAIALGGGLYTVNRFITDQFSNVGRVLSLSGCGDALALGDIQPGYYPLPVPTDGSGRAIIPAQLQPAPAAAAARPGMAGINRPSRFTGRF